MKTTKKFWIYSLIVLGVLLNSCMTNDDPSLIKQDKYEQSVRIPNNLDQTLAELKGLAAAADVKKAGYNSRVEPIIIAVPDDFVSIQAAVNSAIPGDEIQVLSGNYNELIRIVTENIQVKAIGDVNLLGGFQVRANKVEITNFHITPDYQNQGILISESSMVAVNNNYIIADENIKGGNGLPIAYYGIWMERSTLCSIQNNHFQNSVYGGVASVDSKNGIIENNTSIGTIYGILILGSENDLVKANTCSNLHFSGIGIDKSSNISVKENIFNNNDFLGIYISNSSHNKILGNEVQGSGDCGIWLGGATSNNLVIFNTTDCITDNGQNNNVR